MASRAAGRPSSGVKGPDLSRRQSGSPVDGGQRCVLFCFFFFVLFFSFLPLIFFFFVGHYLNRYIVIIFSV